MILRAPFDETLFREELERKLGERTSDLKRELETKAAQCTLVGLPGKGTRAKVRIPLFEKVRDR